MILVTPPPIPVLRQIDEPVMVVQMSPVAPMDPIAVKEVGAVTVPSVNAPALVCAVTLVLIGAGALPPGAGAVWIKRPACVAQAG